MAEFWEWVDRGSWIATIIGFPFLVISVFWLWREQRRLADELSRRPHLDIGFLMPGQEPARPLPKEIVVIAQWRPDQSISEPCLVNLAARNDGNRTARDLVFNFRYQTPQGREKSDEIASLPINPGVLQRFEKRFTFSSGQSSLAIRATVTMTDSEEQSINLKIILSAAAVAPRAARPAE